MACTLLVAHEHVADLDRIEEWVVNREHGTAGNAEYRVDLELFEGSNHRLRAGYPLRRELATVGRLGCGSRGCRARCP
ncbi:hypothetical protein RQCS_22860 [Rhodococcus qingshengii]|nr:hypothetical protein RQCS_22860 [Rhodococcus qingshengii]